MLHTIYGLHIVIVEVIVIVFVVVHLDLVLLFVHEHAVFTTHEVSVEGVRSVVVVIVIIVVVIVIIIVIVVVIIISDIIIVITSLRCLIGLTFFYLINDHVIVRFISILILSVDSNFRCIETEADLIDRWCLSDYLSLVRLSWFATCRIDCVLGCLANRDLGLCHLGLIVSIGVTSGFLLFGLFGLLLRLSLFVAS